MNVLLKKRTFAFFIILTYGISSITVFAEPLKCVNQVVNPVSGEVLAEHSEWIYISEKKTGQWKKLIPGRCPQWFTDGIGFFYFLDVGYDGDRAELWSANADGEERVRLSKSDYFITKSPVISKDGKKLAYHYSNCRASGEFEDIFVIELGSIHETAEAKVVFRAPEHTEIKLIKWIGENKLQAVVNTKTIEINTLIKSKNTLLRSSEEKPELLKYYKGNEKIPDQLYEAYSKLVKAIETGDQGDINQLCLPHSVTFTIQERPEQSREYGQNMNIPFLKNGFDKFVRNLRKDGEDCYLIRTGFSALWFIETKRMSWKLYRYLDKPIK